MAAEAEVAASPVGSQIAPARISAVTPRNTLVRVILNMLETSLLATRPCIYSDYCHAAQNRAETTTYRCTDILSTA